MSEMRSTDDALSLTAFYRQLLTTWCQALLAHQVKEIDTPGLRGGLLCPLCSRIHGRCGDALYPFMHLAHTTGQSHYLDAAIELQAWSDHVSRPDGSWVNEPTGNEWKGITVGGALALGEALRLHGGLLEPKVRQRWEARLWSAVRFIDDFIQPSQNNINYPASASAALVVAAEVLGEQHFKQKARQLAQTSVSCLTENHLLFGEGKPPAGYSPRGCRAVDIGYNLEESLPNLALYTRLSGDTEVQAVLIDLLRAHLDFVLPDGAIDNSWGTRNFKWTYWGTRTGDGCQLAYALLADHDPRFATAALRNAQLLAQCTRQGILDGGPHYAAQGEKPCLHHTFCHARALASVLDYGIPNIPVEKPLPREIAEGVREFPEVLTWLAAKGPWRATITAYDWVYDPVVLPAGHASGGALSMLWHAALGPVCAASVTEYGLMEASNMQPPQALPLPPLTPHIELATGQNVYTNLNDLSAKVQWTITPEEIRFEVYGHLQNTHQQNPAGGPHPFQLTYIFTKNVITMRAQASQGLIGRLIFHLPIISPMGEAVNRVGQVIGISKPRGNLYVEANQPEAGPTGTSRIFHPVPGLQALPLMWSLPPTEALEIQISILHTR
jgi:hypothetical protein